MREQRPILAILAIDVVDATEVAQPVERVERRENIGTRRARRAGDRRRSDAREDAQGVGRRVKAGQTAARNDAAGREAAIILAEAQIVAHAQLFIGVETADEPVELAVEGLALQAQFLREGVELAIGVVVGRAI